MLKGMIFYVLCLLEPWVRGLLSFLSVSLGFHDEMVTRIEDKDRFHGITTAVIFYSYGVLKLLKGDRKGL